MGEDTTTAAVRKIMLGFAEQTGLSSAAHSRRRYLWTDAHAVCNFLSLYRRTGDDHYQDLAMQLIDQVHNVLGRHRDDDPRSGWISGLGENEGRNHPTAGGLRIGKKHNERGLDDPLDERLEWDRDGQYFHYLTKWMHALYRASIVAGEARYCRWSRELAQAAHAGFTAQHPISGDKRLLWKMSIDLTRALVPSSGLHDPLDGYITYHELGRCASQYRGHTDLPSLDAEIADTAAMIVGQRWATDDPLGIGGLLFDACRATQLTAAGQLEDSVLASELLSAVKESLSVFAGQRSLHRPAEYRLAFRELGLSIGLRGVATMRRIVDSNSKLFPNSVQRNLEELSKHVRLGEAIEDYWRKPSNQQATTWLEHRDISAVMLATSLLPDDFLAL